MEHNQFDGDSSSRPVLALPSPEKAGGLTKISGDSHRSALALPSPEGPTDLIQSIKQAVVPIILAGLILSLTAVSYDSLQNPIQNSLVPLKVKEPEKVDSGLPVRVIIPAITVDATLEPVGIALDGIMGVPESPDNVAWFALGPRPGQIGSAVIAGHYGWVGGRAAVFDNLYKLRKGDTVYVEDDRGEIVSFVVREIRSYNPYADAVDVFGSSDGGVHLNLITCQGTWNETQQSYSERLVVFTDKE